MELDKMPQQPDMYREWLGERIEGQTGTLHGEGNGLWSLDTKSLEKLYEALWKSAPKEDYSKDVLRYSKLFK